MRRIWIGLVAACVLVAPMAAFGQHQGHTMPPTKAPAKKQTTKKPAVKKKQTTKKKSTAKKATTKRKVTTKKATTTTKKSVQQPQHQGHGTPAKQPTKQPTKQPAKQPSKQPAHQGHGEPAKQPAQKPTTQPGHQGHGEPAKQPTQQPQQHQGHGEPAKQPTQQPQHQGHGGTPPTQQQQEFKLPPPEPFPQYDKRGWPKPVMDDETYSFTLFERLEYLPSGGGGLFAWDLTRWQGGDRNRIWLKSEGDQSFVGEREGDGDLEIHYGRQIMPFFDFLTGVRIDGQWGGDSRGRVSLGAGLQGLAPYVVETEAFAYLSQTGQIYFNGTFSRDWYQTQRLILQPRVEANAALNRDRRFGSGAGLQDVDLSLRLRYELRRELAPYIGVSVRWLFGETAWMARARGEEVSRFRFIAGLRVWF